MRLLRLVVLEEVDEVTLVWPQGNLAGELGDAQFLDDLEDVELLVEFSTGGLEQVIFSGSFGPAAATVELVEVIE